MPLLQLLVDCTEHKLAGIAAIAQVRCLAKRNRAGFKTSSGRGSITGWHVSVCPGDAAHSHVRSARFGRRNVREAVAKERAVDKLILRPMGVRPASGFVQSDKIHCVCWLATGAARLARGQAACCDERARRSAFRLITCNLTICKL